MGKWKDKRRGKRGIGSTEEGEKNGVWRRNKEEGSFKKGELGMMRERNGVWRRKKGEGR